MANDQERLVLILGAATERTYPAARTRIRIRPSLVHEDASCKRTRPTGAPQSFRSLTSLRAFGGEARWLDDNLAAAGKPRDHRGGEIQDRGLALSGLHIAKREDGAALLGVVWGGRDQAEPRIGWITA